jgi:CelD/BcsL family acetyltransferase involved in cellulose biosynthesis
MAGAGDRAASFAQPLLYWDTIRWALQRGSAEFDLVGAPTDGVARYKRDWGAREERYSVLRRQAPVHRVAMRLRAAVRPGVGR